VVRPVLADPNEDPYVLYVCVCGLESLGPQAAPAIPELIALLRRPEGMIVCEAARTLGALGPLARDAVPVLLERLHDPPGAASYSWAGANEEQPVVAAIGRLQIAEALWRIDPAGAGQEAVACFIEGVESGDVNVRVHARFQIGLLDAETRKRAVPALRRQLAERSRFTADNPNEHEEIGLAEALYHADQATAGEVAEFLSAALRRDEGDSLAVNCVLGALERMAGLDARPALPALRELRKRFPDDRALQERVGWLIRWLEPEAPTD
jgi:hypothetical protein